MIRISFHWIKIAFTVCILSFFSGCTTISLAGHAAVFKRFDKQTSNISWTENYPREEVWFYSGKNKLQGFIYGKENDKGLIVFSIGIHSYADHYGRIIRYLVDEGWRVFIYNGTGVHGSEGSGMRGLSQSVIDLKAAMSYVENTEDFNDLPVILMGFSMGGYAVSALLNFDYDIDAVVTICAFNSVKELFKYQGASNLGIFHYLIYPQTWLLQKIKFGDLANITAVDGINRTHIPVLIMVNSNDDFLPPDKIGIYAYRDRIINPFAEFIYLEGDDANGHNFPRTHTFWMISQFLDSVVTNTLSQEKASR